MSVDVYRRSLTFTDPHWVYQNHSNLIFVSFQGLPRSTRFLECLVTYLPEWRKALSQFPVIPWNTFIDHVRVNVNPLAADDHMKEVIQQLQLMGEVIYVKGNVCVDVIVLDPKWLCSTVLGKNRSTLCEFSR